MRVEGLFLMKSLGRQRIIFAFCASCGINCCNHPVQVLLKCSPIFFLKAAGQELCARGTCTALSLHRHLNQIHPFQSGSDLEDSNREAHGFNCNCFGINFFNDCFQRDRCLLDYVFRYQQDKDFFIIQAPIRSRRFYEEENLFCHKYYCGLAKPLLQLNPKYFMELEKRLQAHH